MKAKRAITIVALLSLTIGLASVAWAHFFTVSDTKITYNHYFKEENEQTPELVAWSERIQLANGDWDETEYEPNTTKIRRRAVGIGGSGAFDVQQSELMYLGDRPSNFSPYHNVLPLATNSNPNYLGTTTLAGVTVYRFSIGNGGERWIDAQGRQLRIEDDLRIVEATSFTTGSFSIGSIANLPVNYAAYQSRINATSNTNTQQQLQQFMPSPTP